jgi:hypothetical protein
MIQKHNQLVIHRRREASSHQPTHLSKMLSTLGKLAKGDGSRAIDGLAGGDVGEGKGFRGRSRSFPNRKLSKRCAKSNGPRGCPTPTRPPPPPPVGLCGPLDFGPAEGSPRALPTATAETIVSGDKAALSTAGTVIPSGCGRAGRLSSEGDFEFCRRCCCR